MTTDTTPIAPTTTTSAKPTRRPHRIGPLNDQPAVHEFDHRGRKTVAVSLTGSYGTGRHMLLDADAWGRVRDILGARWMLMPSGKRPSMGQQRYVVVSGRAQAVAHCDQPGGTPTLTLARWLAGAGPDHRVRYRDGNTLNLTADNLELETVERREPRQPAAA